MEYTIAEYKGSVKLNGFTVTVSDLSVLSLRDLYKHYNAILDRDFSNSAQGRDWCGPDIDGNPALK